MVPHTHVVTLFPEEGYGFLEAADGAAIYFPFSDLIVADPYALDELATAQDRPRSYLINEAITNYIELHAYQDELVRKGLEDVRAGRVVSHEDVVKRLKRKMGRSRQ